MNKLKEELLITLSFLEPMSLEMIYIDLSKEFLQEHSSLTVEDLLEVLKELERNKKVKRTKIDGQLFWLKSYPKKSLWSRIKKIF